MLRRPSLLLAESTKEPQEASVPAFTLDGQMVRFTLRHTFTRARRGASSLPCWAKPFAHRRTAGVP